jgi:hypothetical protein
METPIDQIVYDQVVENGQGRPYLPAVSLSERQEKNEYRTGCPYSYH